MSRFIKKALEKVPRLERERLVELLQDVVDENELYEASLHSLPNGFFVLDDSHKLRFHNKAAERLVGYPLGFELTEKPIWHSIRDADIAKFLQDSLTNHETTAVREFALDTAAGTKILALSLMPLVVDAKIEGSMIFVQDITERKNRESRLRRAESLASLTTLAAGVAHEIKNPLGSIGIHIQLIQRALNSGKPISAESINHDLEIINEEIARLNGIVVDFLFAVRPMDTSLVLGSLNKVVRELMDFMRYELEQANVSTMLDLETEDDAILLDERFLKQAILNMVKNSMHAMPNGGNLEISTNRTKDHVQLVVTDNGTGIPEDVLEKIFEPYFTTKDFGSGLGLTLVYKIVKEHGADIQVSSKVGTGTTVRVLFPIPNVKTPLLDFKGDLA